MPPAAKFVEVGNELKVFSAIELEKRLWGNRKIIKAEAERVARKLETISEYTGVAVELSGISVQFVEEMPLEEIAAINAGSILNGPGVQ